MVSLYKILMSSSRPLSAANLKKKKEKHTQVRKLSVRQLNTSIALPQVQSSKLLSDARFGPLCFGGEARGGATVMTG
ncbi:hypothetical protein F5Y12DRAFT_761440 [Xylaria sp. FL1777]|nr:hypothetical protein F5Y12DRAFT_761440 [Xylaria sp. FL1777]